MDYKVSSLSEIKIFASANNGIFKTISDLDIHLRPINNSQEVLRMVPGLFIGQHAGGGKSEQIFLRGFDIDHGTDINLTVDGIPVNMVSHAHGQGYADLHWVIPELIDKINFNKGPYFADKGNFTTAGFVEFKTKDYLENSFIKAEGGQFGTFRGITGINLIKPKQDRRNQSLFFAGEVRMLTTRGNMNQDWLGCHYAFSSSAWIRIRYIACDHNSDEGGGKPQTRQRSSQSVQIGSRCLGR